MDKQNTNKKRLMKLINIIRKIEKNIYIRDVSFLGFPAFCIFIPEVTRMFERFDKDAKMEYNFRIWVDYMQNTKKYNYSIQNLISALKFKIYKNYPREDERFIDSDTGL